MYCIQCNKVTINYIDRKCDDCQTLLLFQCIICDRLYKRLITIQNHIKYECHKESIYYCNECSFESSFKMHLIIHIQNEHSVPVSSKEVYMCSVCQRKFSNQQNMLSHARICTHELILRCKYCSFKTKLSYILTKHVEIKHKKGDRKDYQCSNCGKKYEHLKNMMRHKRRSCGQKLRFECDHCKYTTDRKHLLVKHMQQNHSELFYRNKFMCIL
jgi:KRAB domain-containing zinc finger protein